MPIPPNARPALAPGFGYNGSPFWLSEFGGIAYIAPGSQRARRRVGLLGRGAGPRGRTREAARTLRGSGEAAAFAGICYTQLTDVEQEINGLLTYDRRPKFEASSIKALNDLLK